MWEGARSGGSVDVSLMSADELAEYEDKKLKLRKVRPARRLHGLNYNNFSGCVWTGN